ncbi:hypothetical protein [Streptomyces sp. NPDC017890]|uniref:hypothetical protein n=1 Tax=Streptomyces sp. NPDC017890 TaxID=3365015 RepID=UPI0037A06D83
MKLRRSLAVAAAVAVSTPVALFTTAPAIAAGTSAARTQNQPTYAELEKAAADAAKAYEDAVTAQEKGLKDLKATLDALDSDTHPLKAATIAADKAAKDAADARATAEQAVTDAGTALEAAESDADRAEARKTLEAAETGLAAAVGAQQEADATAEKAGTALIDARVAATREYGRIKDALDAAHKAREAAEKALETAGKCVRENGLTSLVTGLPSEVVAGTTVSFTLRVTNGTERTLAVDPLAFVHVSGEHSGEKSPLEVKWSTGSGWQTLNGNEPEHIAPIGRLAPGGQSDVKLTMRIDSVARTTDAFALFASDASDAYRPCVLGPMKRYEFELLPAGSEPGAVDEAEPGQPGEDDDKRPDATAPGTGPSAQGGASRQPAPATGTGTTGTTGNLAETGTSSAMTPLALASAAAVALGAGTVFTVRRRKAAQKA